MSSTTTKKSKAETLVQLQALVTGLQKELPNGTFTLMSTVFTTATLLPVLQGLIAAMTAVNTAKSGTKAALVDLAAEEAKAVPIFRALTRTLKTMFANSPDTLAVFALEPAKVRPTPTAAERAASVAKAKATREARGTKSPKQKALVTGNVTGVTITPITAPVVAPPAAPVDAAPASPPVAAPPAPAQPVATAPSASPTGHAGQ